MIKKLLKSGKDTEDFLQEVVNSTWDELYFVNERKPKRYPCIGVVDRGTEICAEDQWFSDNALAYEIIYIYKEDFQ